jgi:hypothetical protein
MANSPTDPDRVKLDLERALRELVDNLDEYQKRQEYYDGKVGEIIAHPALHRLLAKYGEGFQLNYAGIPADALVDRIDLQALKTGDKTLDDRIESELWGPNDLDDDADDFHLKAAYLGDYYAITWPRPADEDDDTSAAEVIEVIGKHPTTTRVVYSKENPRMVEFGVTRWKEGKNTWRANLFYDDAIHQFVTRSGTVVGDAGGTAVGTSESPTGGAQPQAGTFADHAVSYTYVQRIVQVVDETGAETEDVEEEPAIEFHDYGFPLHHFRPDSKPYGTPVNLKAYGAQDAITKIQATLMAALDYQGFPQRYALMDPNAEEGDDIDDDFNDSGTVDESAGPDSSKTGKSALGTVPGGLWMLRGLKGAGQFDPTDPKGFLDPQQFQIQAAATLTRTPLYEFMGGGDQPSGEARRRADAPIVKHSQKVKGSYGQTWRGIGGWALRYWGIGQGKKVDAVWLPSEVSTDAEGMSLVAAKIENGITPRQALTEAGYTGDQLDAMGVPEVKPEDGYLAQMTPALLGTLATALKDLAAAKTLGGGTIPDNVLTEMVARILGDFSLEEPVAPPLPVLDPTTGLPMDPAAAGGQFAIEGFGTANGEQYAVVLPDGATDTQRIPLRKLGKVAIPSLAPAAPAVPAVPPKGVTPPQLAPTAAPKK